MKRLLAAVAVLSAFALVAPAHADPQRYENGRGYDQSSGRYAGPQSYRGGDHGFSREDLVRLERRIEWGSRSGALTRYESRRLYAQLGELRDLSRYYWRSDGVSWRERRDLEARYDRLSFEVRRQISDADYRGDGYRPDGYRR